MGLPIDITTRTERDNVFAARDESRMLPRPLNNLGRVPFLTNGNTENTLWRSATPPTVTAGAWHRYAFWMLATSTGRVFVIDSITVKTTAAADIALLHIKNLQSVLGGVTGLNNLNAFNTVYSGSTTGDSSYTWHFPCGLYLRGGERIDLYGLSAGTTGFNFEASWVGVDVTDDFDYDLPRTVLCLGDSITGVAAEEVDVKYVRREDGTINGIWPFILKANLALAGKPSRIVNLGISGTNSYEWDWMCSQGRIDHIAAGAMIVNLGMNNVATERGLSSTAGVDGPHKLAMKNICRTYLRRNPRGSIVINSVTDTDVAARLVSVASGIYAGQTRLAAYRAENAAVVAELAAEGIDIQLARTDLAYTTSTPGAFVSYEDAGNRTHPSGAVGQPLMAARIWTALQNTQFA